jgi:hypothetical protein
MAILTQTSGQFIIDDHAIELAPGQVVSYSDTAPVTVCSSRANLIAQYRSQFPEQANRQYPQEEGE